jgi:uncharacterized membrane protein YkgB
MPLLIILLLALLIAQLGFWKALAAILGGILMFAILIVLGLALAATVILAALRRRRRITFMDDGRLPRDPRV